MSNKFTEEQYQEIINFNNFEVVYRLGLVDSFVGEIILFISNNSLQQEAMAIANPLTREWAHDKYVEEENKYYWTTKKSDNYGLRGRLYKTTDNSIKPDFDVVYNYDNDERLTESEIREWGYNPDMFDKEEVK